MDVIWDTRYEGGLGRGESVHGDQLRTVLHVDMDAFYASVELSRHPELQGRPVVVGAGEGRGVVAAASYEARRFGIRSAMSGAEAQRRCPGVIFLPADHRHYSEVSGRIRRVFEDVTPLVEPLALDEAFLDVSGSVRLLGSGRAIAEKIRAEVRLAVGLDCSVGVASNKFVAKLASVDAKPTATRQGVSPGLGVVVIEPGSEAGYVAQLHVSRLWGVGPRTAERLGSIGVETVADLLAVDQRILREAVGESSTSHLLMLAVGRDDRPVVPDRQAKSIGHEETFAADIADSAVLEAELVRMGDLVASRVRGSVGGARTWTIKIRFDDFTTITRSHTWPMAVATTSEVIDRLRPLLASAAVGRRVRLLGVSASQFDAPAQQLDLFAASSTSVEPESWRVAESAVDEVRSRFGEASIGRASGLRSRRSDSGLS
ncbi:MAG: DNA polymerase IV [Actinomycetota bacterium]|nr:DNA polymerase IV [Actinomycetota bacterium]